MSYAENVQPVLSRRMGLTTLVATGICSMLGASVFIVPFMIQRNVPDIGPHVLSAFIIAAFPALLAAVAYAILSSAMPRAGGSYIYASRGLHPYLGFIASFSQWFGLSIVIGVISYVMIPFFRDVTLAVGWDRVSELLMIGWIRVLLSLTFIWMFVWINIRGTRAYERAVVPLMVVMFVLGSVVIVLGFYYNQDDFLMALENKGIQGFSSVTAHEMHIPSLLAASAVLFSSFIGFDSVAQAGGEAKNPHRNLPLAICLTIFIVGSFYFLFTAAVYHTVPWSFVSAEAAVKDITAPGLLDVVLHSGWSVPILLGAAIALLNDLPAMLLSVSRLMFAWSYDGIFPKAISRVHDKFKTPHIALLASGLMASIGVFGCHFAGDFFLGVDIMVTSMMVNFLLMCITVISIPRVSTDLANRICFITSRRWQLIVGWSGTLVLSIFLLIHIWKDLSAHVEAWFFRSTPIYLIVMIIGSLLFYHELRKLKKTPGRVQETFSKLPLE